MSQSLDVQILANRIKEGFENLTLENTPELAKLYALNAHFKDPFNDVLGRDKVAHIFRHMYQQVDSPRFVVTALLAQTSDDPHSAGQIFMRWDFSFQARRQGHTIHGATHFELNDRGLINLHRDYWDAAEELYAKIPLLGHVLRWLQSKFKA